MLFLVLHFDIHGVSLIFYFENIVLFLPSVRPCFSSNDLRFTELGSDSVHLHWTKAELPYCTKQTSSIFYSIEMQEVKVIASYEISTQNVDQAVFNYILFLT